MPLHALLKKRDDYVLGFSYFTDILKKRLGFDYAFGNELEMIKGKLTGRMKGKME